MSGVKFFFFLTTSIEVLPLIKAFKEKFKPSGGHSVQERGYEVGFSLYIFELNLVICDVRFNL